MQIEPRWCVLNQNSFPLGISWIWKCGLNPGSAGVDEHLLQCFMGRSKWFDILITAAST